MQKSATINMRVGILLASVAVFCVPYLALASEEIYWDSAAYPLYLDNDTDFVFTSKYTNTDDPSDTYWQVRVWYEAYNSDQCFTVEGPVSSASSDTTVSVVPVNGLEGIAEIDISYSLTNSTDAFGCLDDSPVLKTLVYDQNGLGNFITFGVPTITGSTTASSSTPEEVAAATGVAALGFATFIGGFTSTLWMWRRFLG